jgi:hypothetical protein
LLFFNQKIFKYEPNNEIILESESFNEGVPYADAFSVRSQFIITFIDKNKCNLKVKSLIFYLKKPNFIARGIVFNMVLKRHE